MLSSARRIPLLAVVLALAACGRADAGPTSLSASRDDPPTEALSVASGRRTTGGRVAVRPEHGFVSFSCDDGQESKLGALDGQLYERFTLLFNPADGLHVGYHTFRSVSGASAVSGEEFRVTEQDNGSFNQTIMGLEGTYRQSVRLVRRTSRRSFALIVKGHYTINANGELTVEREKGSRHVTADKAARSPSFRRGHGGRSPCSPPWG